MKKIALFLGEIVEEYQYNLSMALSRECKKHGIRLIVFHNFSAYGSNVIYSYGEMSVIRIPKIEQYDGFILAADTFGLAGIYEELCALLKKEARGPVICLRKEDEQFYNVLVDDYSGISAILEHFIVKHGFKKICFMKGRADFKDAHVRYQAYLDIMEKYGLEVTEHMTFDGDYWKGRGEQAVEWFWDSVEEKPEAIVCANDYMAISVQQALINRGVKIPEDVCISGFDNCEAAKYAAPPISSIHVSSERIAEAAVEMLEGIWAGTLKEKTVYVKTEERFRMSCGCRKDRDEQEMLELFRLKETLQNNMGQQSMLHVELQNADTMEDLLHSAAYFLLRGELHEKVYICLCDEEEKSTEKAEMAGKYTEYMELWAILQSRHGEIRKERFRRETILPEKYLQDNETLYVSPLHDKNECIGYFVASPGFSMSMRFFYKAWVQGITNCIVRQRMFRESELMAKTLEQYNLDELTGIPNRRKLDMTFRNAHRLLSTQGKSYYVVCVDMDGLKFINDNYGHLVGDEALCALANILKDAVGDGGMAARTGGDEFIICYHTDDEHEMEELIQGIHKAIDEYNSKGEMLFTLSASIGYAKCVQGMMPINCVQQADEMMYAEKRSKYGRVRKE